MAVSEFFIQRQDDFANISSRPSASKAFRIRQYQLSDRQDIRRLCCDTGFLGKPIDRIFCDRELFADLHTTPYLDYEPEWTFVAEADGHLVGYLLGSVRRVFPWLLVYEGSLTALRMWSRSLKGTYDHHRSRIYVHWLLTRSFRECPRHPSGAAHMHFNVVTSYRGQGVGLALWRAFETALQAAGITHYFGEFFSYPGRRPELVYRRFGLRVYDAVDTTIYAPEIPQPVRLTCVHKVLNGQVPTCWAPRSSSRQ
ncbi:GNAT family N-acetyltransferase [Acidithiobacillus sp.]|jgi:GNAT superfamily N-acetyltransferase|uniref:GNAT family N-acetyltransferase n=1 Tax=Acidithiobacillus sp. TaxID=1872118 RepID=UPI0025C1B116|nr:GNAT family N-acetyltransferase [Acidithiobacillus sp.]MCK9189626.1 GNAT family N-acetyltransferase [Acidithiobacillus sp.]MCK9359821.1 GNAT family N-acetyltransferase [Acidithiobacillus sp.]